MKIEKGLRHETKRKGKEERKKTKRKKVIHGFVLLSACALVTFAATVGDRITGSEERSQVYAASDTESQAAVSDSSRGTGKSELPTGIAGVVTSVEETPSVGSTVERIGTSCERVMVGQRVKTVTGSADGLRVGDSIEDTVNSFDAAVTNLSANAKMMSDSDYDTLLHIVEAEAGSEDIKGRVLVANVIMNRVKSEDFPDTVTEVVWDYENGVPQFAPTYDGRINEVTVSEDTKEAVKQALEGVDYSQGALFFVQRSAAEKDSVTWFDKELKKLFKYGVHDFYTYPDETDGQEETQDSAEEKSAEEKSTEEKSIEENSSEASEDADIVQMVKK